MGIHKGEHHEESKDDFQTGIFHWTATDWMSIGLVNTTQLTGELM
jgi:hypothetical protein